MPVLETVPEPRLLRVAAALDAAGLVAPAAVLIRGGRVEWIGPPERVGPVPGVPIEERPRSVVLPALVNAHGHLDLWSVGAVSMEAGFDRWLAEIRDRRPKEPADVRRAVAEGVEASRRGGVVAAADIAGAVGLEAAIAFAESDLAGTSFVEVFGIGRRREIGLRTVAEVAETVRGLDVAPGRIGISPHAPYSCDRAVFEAALDSGLPVTTHLAETPEEIDFLEHGRGPLVDLLRRVGSLATEEAMPADGRHPVDWLDGLAPRRPWLLAHVNYLGRPTDEAEILAARARSLAALDATVVYCPRAARHLGHPRPGQAAHPWETLREAGVRVALGTDGRPCLEETGRLSTLDDVRTLLRDGVPAAVAVEMATVAGAVGLGLEPAAVTFAGGAAAGLLAIPVGEGDPVAALAASTADPTWLLPPNPAAFRGGVCGG